MEKYFLLNENKKNYWEYWQNNNKYIIHYGILGTEGTINEIKSGLLLNAKK